MMSEDLQMNLGNMEDHIHDLYTEKLFEHFLVVGASPEKAADAAKKMEVDGQSFTSKLMKRIGSYMRSSSISKSSHPPNRTCNQPQFEAESQSTPARSSNHQSSSSSLSNAGSSKTGAVNSGDLSTYTSNDCNDSKTTGLNIEENSVDGNNETDNIVDNTSSQHGMRSVKFDSRDDRSSSMVSTDASEEDRASLSREPSKPVTASKRTFISYFSSPNKATTPKCNRRNVSRNLQQPEDLKSRRHSISEVENNSGYGSTSNERFSETVESTLLYHYPLTGPTPPSELCDFCMPTGCRLLHITDDMTMQEIFYGHKQSKRSGRSFTFMLENKTIGTSSSSSSASSHITPPGDDEVNGQHESKTIALDQISGSHHSDGRLYGFCVINSRYLNLFGYGESSATSPGTHSIHTSTLKRNLKTSTEQGPPPAPPRSYDFEAPVCYCFLSKYPFHDFFFRVLYDIIDVERMSRLEMMSMFSDYNNSYSGSCDKSETDRLMKDDLTSASHAASNFPSIDRQIYCYFQRSLLEEILENLLKVKPPTLDGILSFRTSPNTPVIEYHREQHTIQKLGIDPSLFNVNEYSITSADWSLPVFLAHIPLNTLIWIFGLMLCEAKIIVVGTEVGMVACAVSSLTALLHPLTWVAPLIPILPLKHYEFIESPVPLIAGLSLDAYDTNSMSPHSILKLCNDEDNGTITAVFDVTYGEVYISNCNSSIQSELLLPGAEALLQKLKSLYPKETTEHLKDHTANSSNKSRGSTSRPPSYEPAVYSVSNHQIEYAKAMQKHLFEHLQTILEMTMTKQMHLQETVSCDLSGVEQPILLLHKLNNTSSPRSPIHVSNISPITSPYFSSDIDYLRLHLHHYNGKYESLNATMSRIPSPNVAKHNSQLRYSNGGDNDLVDINLEAKRSASERSFFHPRKDGITDDSASPTNSRARGDSTSFGARKKMNIQIKSLRWTEVGGIIIGDGIGSNAISTNWITSQLSAMDLSHNSESYKNDEAVDGDDDDEDGDDDDGESIDNDHDETNLIKHRASDISSILAVAGDKKKHSNNNNTNTQSFTVTTNDESCLLVAEAASELKSGTLDLQHDGKKDDSFEKGSSSAITVDSISRSERTATSSNQLSKPRSNANDNDVILQSSTSASTSCRFDIIALSEEPFNSDVDAFIGRFSSTQLYTEYLCWHSSKT